MLSFDQVLEIANSGLIPHLVGPRGEGKTTYSRDFANHYIRNLRVMNLNAMEATDFCGMPHVKDGKTVYAAPFWMAEADVILLDEIDRVRDSAVKSALLSLLVDKEVNGHRLPDNVIILTAGNGKGDDKHEYDTVEFDEAMKDRLVEIEFRYTDRQKIEYFENKYPNHQFVKFMRSKMGIFKEFSGRRIEAFLKVKDFKLCQYFLDEDTARAFKTFIETNMASLSDVLTGKITDATKFPAITRTNLVKDIVNHFFDIKATEAPHINRFINDLTADEKTVYFNDLRKLCLAKPEKFKEKAVLYDGMGLFKGQKQYLETLSR